MKALPKVLAVGLAFLLVGCEEADKSEEKEEVKTEEVAKPKSNPNLDNSIKAFLEQWVEKKGETVNTIITENFDSVTGYYAYPFKVTTLDKTVTFDLGISSIEVPEQNIISYEGFTESVEELTEDSVGLAIVKYDDNNISQVEVYNLSYDFADIQNSILKVDLSSATKEGEGQEEKEEKTYSTLTVDDWKGMALLTSRDIVSKEMAPIFIVPNSDLQVKRDLTETFYYIIAGTLKSSDDKKTVLESYEGKTIELDFGATVPKEYLDSPVWIHAVTQDGIVQNVEFQSFKGADVKVMAEGMIAYISTAAITQHHEEAEGSNE